MKTLSDLRHHIRAIESEIDILRRGISDMVEARDRIHGWLNTHGKDVKDDLPHAIVVFNYEGHLKCVGEHLETLTFDPSDYIVKLSDESI